MSDILKDIISSLPTSSNLENMPSQINNTNLENMPSQLDLGYLKFLQETQVEDKIEEDQIETKTKHSYDETPMKETMSLFLDGTQSDVEEEIFPDAKDDDKNSPLVQNLPRSSTFRPGFEPILTPPSQAEPIFTSPQISKIDYSSITPPYESPEQISPIQQRRNSKRRNVVDSSSSDDGGRVSNFVQDSKNNIPTPAKRDVESLFLDPTPPSQNIASQDIAQQEIFETPAKSVVEDLFLEPTQPSQEQKEDGKQELEERQETEERQKVEEGRILQEVQEEQQQQQQISDDDQETKRNIFCAAKDISPFSDGIATPIFSAPPSPLRSKSSSPSPPPPTPIRPKPDLSKYRPVTITAEQAMEQAARIYSARNFMADEVEDDVFAQYELQKFELQIQILMMLLCVIFQISRSFVKSFSNIVVVLLVQVEFF